MSNARSQTTFMDNLSAHGAGVMKGFDLLTGSDLIVGGDSSAW